MPRRGSGSQLGGVDPGLLAYQRHAATVTDQVVVPMDRSRRRRKPGNDAVETAQTARTEAEEILTSYRSCLGALESALPGLAALRRPRLLGKVEEGQQQVQRALAKLEEAGQALDGGHFGACGKAVGEAQRELQGLEGPLAIALSGELMQAVMPKRAAGELEANAAERQAARHAVAEAHNGSARAGVLASLPLYHLLAAWLRLATEVLGRQPTATAHRQRAGSEGPVVISPHELETFEDVGGLEDAKARLARTVGALVGDAAGRRHLAHNGILLYGPPGTGKTLLARAVAGEYGLRYIRFSTADIASAYQHEPAKRLRELFALAADSAPCVLFLDEIDAIAARRETLASADQREVVTQLLNSLEDYRAFPGLVVMAATNTLDHLDQALREGRFDSRIAVPLPDGEARRHILEVQLAHHDPDVDWEGLDLSDLADNTEGRSGAALAAIVTGAAQRAMEEGARVSQVHLVAEIEQRSGQDRLHTLEEPVTWADVVLPPAVRQRLMELLTVFQRPDLARQLGVRAPAGLLLYGPPGTGKTTVAKALANEVKASFYELSSADMLSKWVGESEQKVAQVFARARQNRPSIIFIDEIDALLKRRTTNSAAPWEERVVSQFLRELDGMQGGSGVLLVGATNRIDIIDDAIRERRMDSVELPLPDAAGRAMLLGVLCRDVRLAPDVDLQGLAGVTEGMSGADLKGLRNSAGMKALARSAAGSEEQVAVSLADFDAALAERGLKRRRPATPSRKGSGRVRRSPSGNL